VLEGLPVLVFCGVNNGVSQTFQQLGLFCWPELNNSGLTTEVFMLPIPATQLTMSSREIADLVDSRHDDVKRSIQRLADRGTIQLPPLAEVKNHQGQTVSEYQISKRDSYVIVAQLSPEFTARLVDRWQELEAANQFKLPQTFSEALLLAGKLQAENEAQQLLIEQQRPAVEFLDRFVESKSNKNFREVAKILGIKEREFIKSLEDDRIIFRQSGNLLPFAHYQHAGYFTVKTGESGGHAFTQTRFTPSGIAWIARRIESRSMVPIDSQP
jgi:phage antirepressor YoqD-like protein